MFSWTKAIARGNRPFNSNKSVVSNLERWTEIWIYGGNQFSSSGHAVGAKIWRLIIIVLNFTSFILTLFVRTQRIYFSIQKTSIGIIQQDPFKMCNFINFINCFYDHKQ